MPSFDRQILSGPAYLMAPRLLGCHVIREINGKRLVAKIVETEAYDQSDIAGHCYKGLTARTRVLFGPAGFLYVYRSYGIHFCCDITTGTTGMGSSVLIRAVEAIEGHDIMRTLRNGAPETHMTDGPGKVCQALAIDQRFNGHDLANPPLQLHIGAQIKSEHIVHTTRIGITKAKDIPWRFYIKDSPFISKK